MISASASGGVRYGVNGDGRLPYTQFSVTLTDRQSHALRLESRRLGQSISETLRGLLGPWADKRLKAEKIRD